jgi:3-hydroxyisobutyrate dehydrogenase-like beta-hydroxyacid dehydrogenase
MKAAEDAGMDLPLARLARDRHEDAAAGGLDEADFTSIAELYERAAGLRLRLNPSEVTA